MYESFKSAVITWNRTHDDRVKLQYVYAVTAIGLLIVAGVIGLVNDTISVSLLQVVFGLAVLFVVNAIAWALLKSFVLDRLPKSTPRKK